MLKYWAKSSFVNTALDSQQLEIQKIILDSMLANTCIEATAPLGMELGYHVTLIKDALLQPLRTYYRVQVEKTLITPNYSTSTLKNMGGELVILAQAGRIMY